MAKVVKMKDIAQRLGISTMTVSKALSGKPGVGEPLREKIKQLALEMGYVSAGEVRAENRKSYNIGVILANYYTEKCATFYWKLYQEVNKTAVKQNCFILLEIISEEEEREQALPKLLQESKVDGLFVLGCMATDYLRMLSEKVTVPIVYLDFYLDDIKEDSVISNSFYGTYQITHYLLQKGHRQIAFVGTLFSTKSITDRYLGYEKAMMEMGLEVKKEWIIPDRSGARNSMEELPFPAELPTAFVCNCDLTASRVIKQLEESGRKVPEEVSVVGYDDYLYPGLCNVEITSYGVDMEQMAATGLEVMLKRISSSSARKGLYIVDGYVAEKGSVCEQFPEWRENGK